VRGRLRWIGRALALAGGLAAAPAFADGGEAVEPDPAAGRTRVLESRWRRPPGCDPAPTFTVLEGGTRVREARSEAPPCRVDGDADEQVRTWLDEVWIGVDAQPRRRPRRWEAPR
jgi:hypothetical protein